MRLSDLIDLPIDEMVDTMHSYGILSVSIDGKSISLGAPVAKKIEHEPSRFEDETEKQKCGHTIWESNEAGECLHGCDQDKPTQE